MAKLAHGAGLLGAGDLREPFVGAMLGQPGMAVAIDKVGCDERVGCGNVDDGNVSALAWAENHNAKFNPRKRQCFVGTDFMVG